MLREFARRMRREPTPAERRLWWMLRDRRLAGFKFRRQVPVGPYILDFLCKDARVAIEADGGQHADPSADTARTSWLTANGYRVLRFWNGEILSNPDGVYEAILAALNGEAPSP
jgi:very-short-patch-repair endonuclease